MGTRLSQYGTWIACCLSRGRRAPLGESDVDQLVAEFGETLFAGGTFVFRQGDDAAQIHVVRTGSVELSRVINGRRVALQILRPGDVFGDVPAFLGEPEPFDARALEAAPSCLSTPRRCSRCFDAAPGGASVDRVAG